MKLECLNCKNKYVVKILDIYWKCPNCECTLFKTTITNPIGDDNK